MGGLPLRSLLAAVFGPPDRGCHGLFPIWGATGFPGAMGTIGWPKGTYPRQYPTFGGWPQGPWHPPCWGGEDTLARGSRGEYLPGCSLVSSQDGPHIGVLVGTSQESWENTTSQSLDFYRFWSNSSHSRVLLHDYLFT